MATLTVEELVVFLLKTRLKTKNLRYFKHKWIPAQRLQFQLASDSDISLALPKLYLSTQHDRNLPWSSCLSFHSLKPVKSYLYQLSCCSSVFHKRLIIDKLKLFFCLLLDVYLLFMSNKYGIYSSTITNNWKQKYFHYRPHTGLKQNALLSAKR